MKIEITNNPNDSEIKHCEFPQGYECFGKEEGEEQLKIFIKQNTLNSIDEYLSSDMNNELGGVLVGDMCINKEKKNFILIESFIIAEHTNSSLSRLTFTHDTWDQVNEVHERDFPGKKILGWFHSHPGHTVFLSSYDIFIQENFFDMDYMVAYVFDPTINDRGFFTWQDKKIVKSPAFYVYEISSEGRIEHIIYNKQDNDFSSLTESDEIKFIDKKKGGYRNVLVLILCLVNVLLLLFMIYNFYELKQKIILKDEYISEYSELKNENKKLNDRLNNLLIEKDYENLNAGKEKIPTENVTTTTNTTTNVNKDTNSITSSGELNTVTKPTNTKRDTSKVFKKYTVKRGDTMEKISNQFYKSREGIDIMMKGNNIKDKADIKIGQIIELPGIAE